MIRPVQVFNWRGAIIQNIFEISQYPEKDFELAKVRSIDLRTRNANENDKLGHSLGLGLDSL